MKFRAIAVTATATVLCVGLAGSALAAPLGMAKPAPQVTGSRLQSALLPASAFGDGLTVDGGLNTGNTLSPTRPSIRPSGLKCSAFQTYTFVGVFGDTAGATDGINNPNPDFGDFPNLVLAGDQAVLQFQTTQAAASFYNQAYARYRQCSAFSESPGTGDTLELTTQSLYSTTIDKNKAFQLIQYVDISSIASVNFYQNTAVALSGTNVYTIDILNGTNDAISASLMSNLIHRVQALYRHH